MAVIPKSKRDRLIEELAARYGSLLDVLHGRDLKSSAEGAKKGSWIHPEALCYIDSLEATLALEDFKTILAQVKKEL